MLHPALLATSHRAGSQAQSLCGTAHPASSASPCRRSGLRLIGPEEFDRLQSQRGCDLRHHTEGRVARTVLQFGEILLRHARRGLQLLLRQLAFVTPGAQVAPKGHAYILHPPMVGPWRDRVYRLDLVFGWSQPASGCGVGSRGRVAGPPIDFGIDGRSGQAASDAESTLTRPPVSFRDEGGGHRDAGSEWDQADATPARQADLRHRLGRFPTTSAPGCVDGRTPGPSAGLPARSLSP